MRSSRVAPMTVRLGRLVLAAAMAWMVDGPRLGCVARERGARGRSERESGRESGRERGSKRRREWGASSSCARSAQARVRGASAGPEQVQAQAPAPPRARPRP